LASEVRLNVDVDAAATVLANGCYRWLGRQLNADFHGGEIPSHGRCCCCVFLGEPASFV